MSDESQAVPVVLTGKLFASPNPLPLQSTEPLHLTWELSASHGIVCVAEDGEPEKQFAAGFVQEAEATWIRPGSTYTFRLYSATEPRQLLDELVVSRAIEGRLVVEPSADASSFGDTAILHWEVTAPAAAEIWLSEREGEERLVCRGPSGSYQVEGLGAGIPYRFRLYAATGEKALLDEKPFVRAVAGSLRADPNPVTFTSGGRTTLHWVITAPAIAEIRLLDGPGTERCVTCGASGSFEVTALRAGRTYTFRLYAHPEGKEILDEITLPVEGIPWDVLQELLAREGAVHYWSEDLAQLIATVLPHSFHQPEFARWFRLWEEKGAHVTPVHFYEPIPDSRELTEKIWEKKETLPGVELNAVSQRRFLEEILPPLWAECRDLPDSAPAPEATFYLRNGRFEGLDPILAYGLVRHYHPRQIIEVGSGFSTLIPAHAALKNGTTELHSIEPYPEDFLVRGVDGLTSLSREKVESVPPERFARLAANDILFIDSSHVVRIGGDVNYLFLEVLPRLQPGVIVHAHDIFFPYDYPADWVLERRRFWTEQYLLQAFLAGNTEFEVLVSSGYLKAAYPERLRTLFPRAEPWQGGSFWMRRRPDSRVAP